MADNSSAVCRDGENIAQIMLRISDGCLWLAKLELFLFFSSAAQQVPHINLLLHLVMPSVLKGLSCTGQAAR